MPYYGRYKKCQQIDNISRNEYRVNFKLPHREGIVCRRMNADTRQENWETHLIGENITALMLVKLGKSNLMK